MFMVTKFILNLCTNQLCICACVRLQMVLSAGDQTDLISVNLANAVFQCESSPHSIVGSLVGLLVCSLLQTI